jgi:hypothetical protein
LVLVLRGGGIVVHGYRLSFLQLYRHIQSEIPHAASAGRLFYVFTYASSMQGGCV